MAQRDASFYLLAIRHGRDTAGGLLKVFIREFSVPLLDDPVENAGKNGLLLFFV